MNAAVFDKWRADYATSTIEDHAAIYDEVFKKDPAHASFSGRAVRVFLNQMRGATRVAEIAGRNGALAKAALDSTPSLKCWINYEISGAAIVASVTQDPRYEARLMTDFRWWKTTTLEGEILIMSHFIEHVADGDFRSLLDSIPANIRGIHVQSPLAMRGPINWAGFGGAHILSMGWREVDEEFVSRGWKALPAYDGATWMKP